MSDVRACGQCGVTLPADSPHGVCPSCLMRLGVGEASGTPPHQAGRQSFVPPKPHELSVHFPRLEILDLIGQGGMGAVYKARQVGLDRIVALKILPPHAGDDGSFAGRFEREARSLARLSHPNIITVFDSGRAGDFYYFVMEFIDGVNLRDAIRAGKLAPNEALAIVPQLCDALQYAHDEGIVHRDIKPENVLIDKKGNTKIADFGLARLLGPTDDLTLTGTHQVMGTPRYMAPEQMEGSHAVDHRADIYSLGVVFYEMLTGELPMGRFDGPSKKVQIDVRLDEVVFRTLEKEPARRYQHASEIKTDVQTICGPHGGMGGASFVGTRRPHHSEYKSKIQLFGWPLVHITSGIDPKTKKLYRSRGIIAIGHFAYGVIAIGNFAVGGIAVGSVAVGGIAMGGGAIGALALGGGALGLFSLGGLAVGLLLAGGGLALGVGLSLGGMAVGTVAIGPLAVGWFAYAGRGDGKAYGVHAMGSNVWGAEAVRFFEYFAAMNSPAVPVALALLAISTFLTGLLISIRLLGHKKDGHNPEVQPNAEPRKMEPPRWERASHRSNWGIVIPLALVVCLMAMCVLPQLVLRDFRQQDVSVVVVHGDQATSSMRTENAPNELQKYFEQMEVGDAINWIIWTEDGPTLDPHFENPGASLTSEQLTRINQIFSDAMHQAYVKLEQENMKQEWNEARHSVTTVEIKDANQVAELENQVWTQIDSVVDVSWQQMMRGQLELKSQFDVGMLGFAGRRGVIEIWKVGSWYHWQVSSITTGSSMGAMGGMTEGMSGGGPGRGGGLGSGSKTEPQIVPGREHSGPKLPIRLRRFWHEPAATAEGTSR